MHKYKEQYLVPGQPFSLTNEAGDSSSFPANFLQDATFLELSAYGIVWEDDPVQPEPTPEELAAQYKLARTNVIKTRLAAIDIESIRPLRSNPRTTFDTDKLAALDTEANLLRTELRNL